MTDACLEIETLVNFVEGRADSTARARIEFHAAWCASCREELSALARSGSPEIAPAAPPSTLPPRPVIGRYVITHQIGAGGMGMVYAARDPELDRVVAVKVLRSDDERLQSRLHREAQSMAQLAHPNVVAVYDVGTFDGRMFIAMEYVLGETLAGWLATGRSQRDIIDVYRAAGNGLAAAHAAGIVHRDFKPENVLIGGDGRVRVGDFGLARVTGNGDAHGAAGSPAAEAQPAANGLTAPGTLLGTPYYIAPELFAGAEASARSDQFSFCVALFTALYGERPFGDDVVAALGGVRTGRLHDPGTRPRVPRRIRAALQRGLAVDPAARFASLDELLAELAPRRPRRARWLIGLTAALAVIGWLLVWRAEVPDQRCTGAAAAFAKAWNAERRGAIGAAFAASRTQDATTTLDRVAEVLDQYAARWTEAHTAACRATRIVGEQTEATLELRMSCLDRQRQEVAAVVNALATADAPAVARSMEAVTALADVAVCADATQLRDIVPPPADPVARARLAALTARLADASARYQTGALAPALALARSVSAEAHQLAYQPLQAEADLLLGSIENDLADANAETSFEAAVWAAEVGRADRIAGRAWIKRIEIIGLSRTEFAKALELVPRVTAVITRLGGDAVLEIELERVLGGIELRKRNLASALSHAETTRTIAQRAFGPDHLRVASAHEAVGNVLLQQGRADSALQEFQPALRIYQHLLVPDHYWIARILHNLGKAHLALDNYLIAEQELREALKIRTRALGEQHPKLCDLLNDLGRAVRGQGRAAEALEYESRADEIAKTLPPDHIMHGANAFEIGVSLGVLGRYDEADKQLRRAKSIAAKLLGPEHVLVMDAIRSLGDLQMAQSHWSEAAALYESALPILEKAPDTDVYVATVAAHLGLAYVELHQPARALALFHRLARALHDPSSDVRVVIDFATARASWDTGGDRAQAHELAARALVAIGGIPAARRADIAQIERWLASHPAPASQPP